MCCDMLVIYWLLILLVWHVWDCGVRVVEKMSKDIGMRIRKKIVGSF